MTIIDMFEARGEQRGEQRGLARGIIKNGRRHAFSDDIIMEDIAAETGCTMQEAEKILREFEKESEDRQVMSI